MQKRTARIILKANFDTPSSLMFQELGWLSVENRLKYNKAVITYRTEKFSCINKNCFIVKETDTFGHIVA